MEVMRGIFVLRLKLDVSGENVMQMMEMDIGQRERGREKKTLVGNIAIRYACRFSDSVNYEHSR